MGSDEWRVEVSLDDEQHGYSLGEWLRSLDLDEEAAERLGGKVVVTRDGSRFFFYGDSQESAREAEGVVRELLAGRNLSADLALTRWHPVEEAWKDASLPLPETETEIEAESERHEAAEFRQHEETGVWDWEVRIGLGSMRETLDLAKRLKTEGFDVRRRWRYLLVGAPTEERAAELGERIRAEAPEGADIRVEVSGVSHPVFVLADSVRSGIGRDLGI